MGAAGRPGLDRPLQVDRKQACPAIPAPATHCPPYVHLSFPQEPVTSPCMLPPGPTPGCMTPGVGVLFLGSRVPGPGPAWPHSPGHHRPSPLPKLMFSQSRADPRPRPGPHSLAGRSEVWEPFLPSALRGAGRGGGVPTQPPHLGGPRPCAPLCPGQAQQRPFPASPPQAWAEWGRRLSLSFFRAAANCRSLEGFPGTARLLLSPLLRLDSTGQALPSRHREFLRTQMFPEPVCPHTQRLCLRM